MKEYIGFVVTKRKANQSLGAQTQKGLTTSNNYQLFSHYMYFFIQIETRKSHIEYKNQNPQEKD